MIWLKIEPPGELIKMEVEGKQTQWPHFKCSLTLSVPFIFPPPPPNSALPTLLSPPLLLLHRFCLLFISSTFLSPSFNISPFSLHFSTSSFRLSVSSFVLTICWTCFQLLLLNNLSSHLAYFFSNSSSFSLFLDIAAHTCFHSPLSTHRVPEDNWMCDPA